MDEKKTSLYDVHVRYGGKMVPFAGYLLPVQYEGYGVIQEHMAVRRDCGLFDVSHMGEILCEGEGALDNLNYLLTEILRICVMVRPGVVPCVMKTAGWWMI